tara:strand:- start:10108 stop:10956 length:849 start_codon:yes stop_codon:yes gene_type:complete
MEVKSYFHTDSSTFTHLVWDTASNEALIVDPVLDFDYKSGATSTASADTLINDIIHLSLKVKYIFETHAHADHLSAAPYIQQTCGGQTGIGAKVPQVQQVFKNIFNIAELAVDGSQFDLLLGEGDTLTLGQLPLKVLTTPGHTPACVSYQIGDAIFIGDTFFAPTYGTARTDFPGGSAATLYQSLQRLLSFPDQTRLFLCHDYPDRDDKPKPVHSVAEQRTKNVHLQGDGASDYIKLRNARDAQLDMPTLILPSIQVNIRAGEFPPPDDNGVSYLKIPLNQF